jgi:hypothetical protein
MFRTDYSVHEVVFIFPPDWSFLPPTVYFLIPLAHPKVGIDGRVRMKELEEEYHPKRTTVFGLVLALQDTVYNIQNISDLERGISRQPPRTICAGGFNKAWNWRGRQGTGTTAFYT